MWDEEVVRAAARRRHGLVGRADLLKFGLSTHEINRRIRSGRLERLHPGVYYLDATPPTWKTDVLAGVMAAGLDALASHRTAAVLWGVDAIRGRMIEVTVPYNDQPEPTGVILHRTRRGNPGLILDGIPVVAPERALMDISPFVNARTLEKAMRSGVHKGLTTVDRIDRAIGVYGGRGVAGTRVMRRVLSVVASDESESVAEIDLKHIAFSAPIPRPVQQLRVRLPNGSNAYLDLAWPGRMRLVEADGFGAHSTPEQLQHDLSRQNLLMDLGWEIRRFTATDIRERPDEVREQLVRFVNKPFREG